MIVTKLIVGQITTNPATGTCIQGTIEMQSYTVIRDRYFMRIRQNCRTMD